MIVFRLLMQTNNQVRRLKDYAILYIKGMAMGVADVIPGVSGGTIAFITGIYDELIESIRSINIDLLKKLFQGDLAGFWKSVNGNFLISVLAGIGTSLISLASIMSWLLTVYPVPVWSFFFGLILISAPLIFREIQQWTWPVYFSLVAGVVMAYFITILTPAETPVNLPFIFFCGALAICAMILPGISGAFILLLIGKYQFMIDALRSINFPVILVFVAGCVVGLTAFSHVLNWLLKNYRRVTLALLAGFMLGSLNKVWPWKEVTEWRLNHEGQQVPAFDRSIWPAQYQELTGQAPQVLQAILFCLAGILLVVAIDKTADYFKRKSNLN